jgi:DNA excision repair protein ERCC-4
LDRGIFSSFESLLQQQLGPVWHTLSPTTRTIVSDLKQLRILAESLFQHDCVSFYHQLLAYRAARASRWLLYDRADDLFVTARQRVYRPVDEVSC